MHPAFPFPRASGIVKHNLRYSAGIACGHFATDLYGFYLKPILFTAWKFSARKSERSRTSGANFLLKFTACRICLALTHLQRGWLMSLATVRMRQPLMLIRMQLIHRGELRRARPPKKFQFIRLIPPSAASAFRVVHEDQPSGRGPDCDGHTLKLPETGWKCL